MTQPPNQGSIPPPGSTDSPMGVPQWSAALSPAEPLPGHVAEPGGLGDGTSVKGPQRSMGLILVAGNFLGGAVLGGIGLLLLTASALSYGAEAIAPLFFGLLFAVPFVYAAYVAGRRLWDKDERGRKIGIVLASIGLLGALVSFALAGSFVDLVIMAGQGLIIWFLVTTRELV